ncbi:MAG: pilus assembly protein [Rhodobacterales bacterium]|nr:pilus assembly protein [Rhodobacterales bacterium]
MTATSKTRKQGRTFYSYLTDDSGSVTIEFLLMLPLFTTFLLLATDASMLFLRQTTLMNVARDTARAVARYAMTPAEAKAYAQKAAATGQGAATATVTIKNGAVTVLITTNAQSAAPFGIVNFAVGDTISGSAINTMEPI